MSRVRLVATLSLGLLLGVGCSFSSLLDALEREYEETEEIVCACSGSYFEYACEGLLASHPDFDDPCVIDAFELDKEASEESLDCSLHARKSYNDCMKVELDCSDFNTYGSGDANNCRSQLDNLNECPELPTAVQTALNKCD